MEYRRKIIVAKAPDWKAESKELIATIDNLGESIGYFNHNDYVISYENISSQNLIRKSYPTESEIELFCQGVENTKSNIIEILEEENIQIPDTIKKRISNSWN